MSTITPELVHNLIIDYFTGHDLLHIATQLKSELKEAAGVQTFQEAVNPRGSYLEALLTRSATPDIVESLQLCFDESDDHLTANQDEVVYSKLQHPGSNPLEESSSDRLTVTSDHTSDVEGEDAGAVSMGDDPLGTSRRALHGLQAHRANRGTYLRAGDYPATSNGEKKELTRVSSSRTDVVDPDAQPFAVPDASPIKVYGGTGDDEDEEEEEAGTATTRAHALPNGHHDPAAVVVDDDGDTVTTDSTADDGQGALLGVSQRQQRVRPGKQDPLSMSVGPVQVSAAPQVSAVEGDPSARLMDLIADASNNAPSSASYPALHSSSGASVDDGSAGLAESVDSVNQARHLTDSVATVYHVPPETGGAEFVHSPTVMSASGTPRSQSAAVTDHTATTTTTTATATSTAASTTTGRGSSSSRRKDSHISASTRRSETGDTWSDDDDVGYRRVMEEEYMSQSDGDDYEPGDKWGGDDDGDGDGDGDDDDDDTRGSVEHSLDVTEDSIDGMTSFDRSTELEQSILDEIAKNEAKTAQLEAELREAGVDPPGTPSIDEGPDDTASSLPNPSREGSDNLADRILDDDDDDDDDDGDDEEEEEEEDEDPDDVRNNSQDREASATTTAPPAATGTSGPGTESRSNAHPSGRAMDKSLDAAGDASKQHQQQQLYDESKYSQVDYDDFYPVQEGEVIYDAFSLRVVTQRDKTGFEESSRYPIVPNSIIAGRYQILEFLGSAAFSDAVQCLDLATGELVCIKIIKNSKDFFDQSLDEVKLLKYINSAGDPDEYNVLRLYDFFYHKEHLFLVCELLRDNLYEFSKYSRECCNEQYFTLPRLQRIMKQCLWALQFIHSLNLVHCDLKPENILIKSYSRCLVKIIDFGSSCFGHDRLASYVQSRSYRAPEVILGLPWTQAIDIWSMGCILAELWTGKVLFQNNSIATLLARLVAILGPIPEHMLRKGRYSHKYFSASGVPYEYDETTRRNEFLLPKPTTLQARLHSDDTLFIDFVSRLLAVDPADRPSAQEALKHPWLAVDYGTE